MTEDQIKSYFHRLWPINRSLTGKGVRETLAILSELVVDLNVYEIPSGTTVFDWTVPKEWDVIEAYIETPEGRRIADFSVCNLHLLGYSIPFNGLLTYEELKKHIYTIPDQPTAIPYLTSYYKERWGFCMTHHEFSSLSQEGLYKVVVDTRLFEGALTYADAYLEGQSKEEIVFSTYICHPSMANNELSGPLVAAFLYQKLKTVTNRYYSYRFIFTPETVGTIAYLHQFGDVLKSNVLAGYVITCVGNEAPFTYKKSRKDDSQTNLITEHILKYNYPNYHKVIDFVPTGSDERQYCSPGFNLPFGSLMRTMYGEYKEYHTSLDNIDFISFAAIEGSVNAYWEMMKAFELNHKYKNLLPYGEVQLGKRGLYPDISTTTGKREFTLIKILYLLNYSDGDHFLIDIAEKIGCSILDLEDEVQKLINEGILTWSNHGK